MTFWVFGDSFSKHFRKLKYFPCLSDSWIERSSKILNHNVVSFSKPLSTLEHIFFNFENERSKFSRDDVIIITLTNLDRRWVFRDNHYRLLKLNDLEKESVNDYLSFLQPTQLELQNTYVSNFLYNLNNLSSKLNLHTIVLASFLDAHILLEEIKYEYEYINFSNLPMAKIAFDELKSDFSSIDFGNDVRINHLTKDNHIVMSDKIVNNVTNKVAIDLTEGFKKNIINEDTLKNTDFIKDQLFDNISSKLQIFKL